MSEAAFAMLTCACGAERAVKQEMGRQQWRLAFSRPGFVTAKGDAAAELPEGIFIRTAARSLGTARGPRLADLVAELEKSLAERTLPPFDQLHVWPKDRVPIGRFGFEPGIDEVSRAVAGELFDALGETYLRCDAPNQVAAPGDQVLDVVLVEPSHWFFGCHTAGDWPSRWPGAVQPLKPRHEPISRAYFKAAEAITWSGFDFRPGDLCVEVGSAPGGACGRLLELEMRVLGIDPAEMDPRIDRHPNFRHLRARAGDLKRAEFRGAKWMLVDSNVKPDKTLTTVENIVTHRASDFRGLLLTMKLGDYENLERIDRWRTRIQTWQPTEIRIRQLARNKCEVCVAVTLAGGADPG